MKLKEFFKNLFVNVKDGVSRFFAAFICCVLFFITISYNIIFETDHREIINSLCMTFGFVAVLSVLLKLTAEYIFEKFKAVFQYIACGVIAVLSFILIKANYNSLYMTMAYWGIIISMLCFVFFMIMRGENRDTAFPKIVASGVFALAIGGVLSGGLSTCIWAFDSLIFSYDNTYKVYEIVNLFVWAICVPNLFLALIPKKDVPVTPSKVFRIFILFALLPLYILLIAILLVYLAKIVITWNMPVGEINWFASFASLFFIFILMSVMQYTEKAAKLFVKFGGYFLIPVLIMQAIAVFERINAYGLTTPRTVSLVLIVISALFISGAIIIPKHLNKIALASGIIVLIVTVTPFNVIDMPIASQTNILETVLTANGMLEGGAVVPGKDIADEDKERILSAFNYLKYDAQKLPDFISDKDKNAKEIFGFEHEFSEKAYTYCDFHTKDSVDISGYSKMTKIHSYDEPIKTEHNGIQYEIVLNDVAKELYETYGTGKQDLDLYVYNENISLYFEYFSFRFEDNEFSDCTFNGYVLFK